MLYGMFRQRAISLRISRLNIVVGGRRLLGLDLRAAPSPPGRRRPCCGSNSIVAIGSTSAASPPAGALVFMKTAKLAADSAAAITASVYRRSWAKSGRAGRMSGRPRRWPGRSARNQWIMLAAGTRSYSSGSRAAPLAGMVLQDVVLARDCRTRRTRCRRRRSASAATATSGVVTWSASISRRSSLTGESRLSLVNSSRTPRRPAPGPSAWCGACRAGRWPWPRRRTRAR